MIPPSELRQDPANSSLAPDTVLQNRYRIVRQLGRGGMGAVYEALDQRLQITVALKETLSSDTSVRKQFEHEARLLAGMQHPALPRVSDHFVEGNRAFLVMQFIGGVDLARIISQQPGPFPRESVIAWADQLLDALIYLHTRDRQVIHRDIKPHNLKLTGTGQIALLDFGLAKAQTSDSSSASATASRAFFGYTRHYAPLEQIQDQRTDPRSDIYALGATLYHLLTGIKPPDAMVRATALLNSEPDPLKPANEIHEAVGPDIAAILDKAMAQRPEDRYRTANEFREALRCMGRTNTNEGIIPKPVRPVFTRTVHIDHLNDIQEQEGAPIRMALVESASRFGHGAITLVLVILITLTAGVLYSAQGWFQSGRKASGAKSTNAVATQRQVDSARKPERARAGENNSAAVARTRNANEFNASDRTNQNRQMMTPGAAQPATERGQDARKSDLRKNGRRINAPRLRLPTLEFRDNYPAPSPSRNRSYDSSGAAPRFLRAPDGGTIVKFSDGSTRLVRAGERSAKSGAYQR